MRTHTLTNGTIASLFMAVQRFVIIPYLTCMYMFIYWHARSFIHNSHVTPLSQISDPIPTGVLDQVSVIMSGQGEACDKACTGIGKRCSAQHLAHLNTCDSLREHVGCEAGCEPGSSGIATLAAMPLYVNGNAPKPQRPAMCFTAPMGATLECGEKDAQSRRICACS